MPSDVAAIREKIELECIALNNLKLPASVASHSIVRNAYRRIQAQTDKLATVIGEEQAIDIACNIYCKVVG